MSNEPSLFERLKQARIVQVLVVYLAASWGILQLVDTLMGMLGLPEWLGPVTVVLLGVGLLVVAATAWVQSLDSTTKAEEAGERPSDWEVDAAGAIASLKSGRLPHLTWGRAIMGGIMALSLAIGGAGAYVLVTGGQGLIGPAEAGASSVAEGIAVLPFDARGEDLAIYREGMVDLLSASFDGIGGYRTIDSRTVFARWAEEVGETSTPDLDVALRAAGRTGARYAILGSMVPAGTQVRLDVNIYDVGDGSQVGHAQIDGSPDEIFALVDGLSVAIARELLGAAGESAANVRSLENITTSSPAALKDFLEGERLHRLGSFDDAAAAYERAVAADSLFALAWAQLAATTGWVANQDAAERSDFARTRSVELVERLSPREATLVRARGHYQRAETEAIELFEEYVRRYPDDADAWYQLGDSRYHMAVDFQGAYPSTREEVLTPLRRASELDPTFAPYYIHLVDFAFATNDSTAAAQAIDAYWANGGSENVFSEPWDVGFRVLFGTEDVRRAAIDDALELSRQDLILGLLGAAAGVDNVPREVALIRALADRDPGRRMALVDALERAGRLSEMREVMASLPVNATVGIMLYLRFAYGVGSAEETHDVLASTECGANAIECFGLQYARVVHGALDGHAEERAEAEAAIPGVLEAALDMPLPPQQREVAIRVLPAMADELPAFTDLALGNAERAYDYWSTRGGRYINHLAAAQAAEAVGDLEMAERFFLVAEFREGGPVISYRLAQLYEGQGRTEEALERYRRAAIGWAEADADFQPWIDVQEALSRLGG